MSYRWRERILSGRSRADRLQWLLGALLLLLLVLVIVWLALDERWQLVGAAPSPSWRAGLPRPRWWTSWAE